MLDIAAGFATSNWQFFDRKGTENFSSQIYRKKKAELQNLYTGEPLEDWR